jgi:predicted RNase H-like HicB family nuclease
MTSVVFRVRIFQEGEHYVALSPELNVSSFGDSVADAKRSLTEAVEAFVEECERMGTLEAVLEEAGFVKDDQGRWVPRIPVAEEQIALTC